MYLLLEVVVDHNLTIENVHNSTIESSDLNSMTENDHSSTKIVMINEVNGKTTIKKMIQQETISKDLKDQVTILATDNSEWTNLEINLLRSSITVPPIKLKKRGTSGSIREIRETDLLKSNSLTDEE